MFDGPQKLHPRSRVIAHRSCRRPHYTKGELEYRHVMNQFKAKKEHQLRGVLIIFDLGFSSGVVNKAQSQTRISITAGCYLNFEFSGTK